MTVEQDIKNYFVQREFSIFKTHVSIVVVNVIVCRFYTEDDSTDDI